MNSAEREIIIMQESLSSDSTPSKHRGYHMPKFDLDGRCKKKNATTAAHQRYLFLDTYGDLNQSRRQHTYDDEEEFQLNRSERFV